MPRSVTPPKYPEGMYVEVVWSNIGEEFVVMVVDGDQNEIIGNRGKVLSEVLEAVADDVREKLEAAR